MKISKEQAAFLVVLFTLLAACAGVMFFYFFPKLEAYNKDLVLEQQLKDNLAEFEKTFSGVKPNVLIAAVESRVQPWKEARDRYGALYNMDGWFDRYEPRPEEQYPKFWYDEESTRLLTGLVTKIRQTQPNLRFSGDFYTLFDVPTLEDWRNEPVISEAMAKQALSKLSYGITFFERLLQFNVVQIEEINLWDARKEKRFGEWVRLRTTGLSFVMKMKDLTNFLESFNAENRFVTVDAIRINWMYPAYEPYLSVNMLLTQANWVDPDSRPKDKAPAVKKPQPQAGGGAQGQVGAGAPRTSTQTQQPGFFGKAWKWFKEYVLVMH